MSKERWILAIGGLATGLIDVVGWMMFRDTTTCVPARVARAHSTVRFDHAQGYRVRIDIGPAGSRRLTPSREAGTSIRARPL